MDSFFNAKIPTIVGLFLIVVGIGVTSFLTKEGVPLFGHAAPTENPQNVRMSNITDSSFTLTYTTPEAVIGSISLGKDQSLGQRILDDRDQISKVPALHKIHSITATHLSPSTTYLFSITSGSSTYLNNGKLFEVTTAPSISDSPKPKYTVKGMTSLPDNQKIDEAILYVKTDTSQLLSSLITSDGSYTLPLTQLHTSDLTGYIQQTDTTIVKLFITNGILESQIITTLVNSTNTALTILSKNYDFSNSSSSSFSSSKDFGFPSFSLDETATSSPQIISPKHEEKFSDQQPLFQGTAVPGEDVTITIHSSESIEQTVKANKQGQWSYRSTTPLSPGEHTITIVTRDFSGILRTIEQNFVVYAQGSKFTDNISPTPTTLPTPTATLTPTPTPHIATPTPTITPFISPTKVPTLTPTPLLIPTATPTPLPLHISPTPPNTPPEAGNATVMTVGSMGIVIMIMGMILLLITYRIPL